MRKAQFLRSFPFFAGLALLGVGLLFQNCGSAFEGNWDAGASLSQIGQSPNPTQPEPVTPVLDPPPVEPTPTPPVVPAAVRALQPNLVGDCATNPAFNSCIFWKNPVAQRGAAFATRITNNSSLDDILIHGVNLTGLDGSGFLRNATLNVTTSEGTRVLASDGNYKRSYNTQPNQVTQLMVYHWMNTSVEFMKHQTGKFHAENRAVRVDAVDPSLLNNAFYRVSTNQVTMGRTAEGTNFGLSGEIAIHELAHANHRHGSAYAFSATNTATCPTNVGGTCCTNALTGCHRALAEGSADYSYAILFPQSLAGGETVTNNILAPARCGLNRNIGDNMNLTVRNTPCANIHVLGMIYAGMWFRVRQQAEQLRPGLGSRQVDTLFSEHLLVLAEDTWASIFNKIITLDQSLFNGQHRQLFLEEFNRRGINVTL